MHLNTLLSTVRLLFANPNPDDGLMQDITEQHRRVATDLFLITFQNTGLRTQGRH